MVKNVNYFLSSTEFLYYTYHLQLQLANYTILVYDKKICCCKTVLCLPLPSSPAQNKRPNYDILALHFRKNNFYLLFSHRVNTASITYCRIL